VTRVEWDGVELRAEAEYLHRAIFRRPLPQIVADRYARLHDVCFASADAAQRRTVREIVARQLDAEAVECALRMRAPRHLLTTKVHALLYLVEVRRDYYPIFFNERDAHIRGKVAVVGAVLRTVAKAVKGAYLVRRYRLD
jgi:hypothetical protein